MLFNGDNIRFIDGTASININAWLDFPKFIEDNKNLKGYICRGHARSSFKLVPKIVRLHQERHSPSPFDSRVITKQLRWFRLNIRGRVTLTDREAVSESEVWAIGQHNGLATTLLDWTASPLVAAFFAFIDDRPFVLSDNLDEKALNQKVAEYQKTRDEDRTIFILNARKINRAFYNEVKKQLPNNGVDLEEEYPEYVDDDPDDGQGFPERVIEGLYPVDPDTYKDCRVAVNAAEVQAPRVIAPLSGENPRLVNQRGLFTKYAFSEPLEEWVKTYFAKNSEAILLKIDIANSQRDEALRWLDAANVNFLSLYPDVYGAACFANSKV